MHPTEKVNGRSGVVAEYFVWRQMDVSDARNGGKVGDR